MSSIKIAKNSGFCFGVKRAIKIALETAKNNQKAVTLGPIIHNPQMVNHLKNKGVVPVFDFSEIKNRTAIIRSHGITQEDCKTLTKSKTKLIDATCPYVARTRDIGCDMQKKGYQVIILGDKKHPEVQAIRSYIEGDVIIVNSPSELPIGKKWEKVGLISQTTKQVESFKLLVDELINRCYEILIINTICTATSVRQKSTNELAKECDLMIVIGGKNSSNTKQLFQISSKNTQTYHIETDLEIKKEWFSNKERIGLTAGASTPDWCILNIYNKIANYFGDNNKKKIININDIPGY